jgi:hypothetical protein
MLGGDDRDRLAEVADAVEGQDRLILELEAVALLAGDVLVGERTAWTPGMETARLVSMARMNAWACGLRTVWPQSMSAAKRSLA